MQHEWGIIATSSSEKKIRGRNHLRDIGVNMRKILKLDFREIGMCVWIQLAQNRIHWSDFVNMETILQFP
jgi:hypothetical protein